MMKPWYQSKTVWFNLLAVAVLVANRFGYLDFKLDPVMGEGILAVVNLVLRFITRTAVRV